MATRSNPAPFREPRQSIIVAAYQRLFFVSTPALNSTLCRYGIGNLIEMLGPNQFNWPAISCPCGCVEPLVMFPHAGLNFFIPR